MNTYTYVLNNPINFVDPRGLSQEDVNKIVNAYNQSVQDMTAKGERNINPYINNINRSLYDATNGAAGKNYKVCWGQAETVQDELKNLKLDDSWKFEEQHTEFPPHYWLTGESSNPNDPHLVIDPWRDTFTMEWKR